MKSLGLSRYALSGCAAAALLAGCDALRQAQDDTQPPIGAPGAMSQTSALAARTNGSNYKVMYSFRGTPDGQNPSASLIDVGGTFYGTTEYGGSYRYGYCYVSIPCGTVFSITRLLGVSSHKLWL